MMETNQMEFWLGKFGKEYTDRNRTTLEEFDRYYVDQYGITRSEINQQMLGDYSIGNVLEVGCNVGEQLRSLQSLGYSNLYGIELQQYAVEKSKEICREINIIQGSAFDLPFKDNYFDLVFTNGVLIHISPEDLNVVIDEMVRVSKRYIWGFEYYAPSHIELEYRGNSAKMWKGDFAKLFLQRHPNLQLVKVNNYKYLQSDNIDQMYLLEKKSNI
jgi:pseudaminic acid biosynthesis-associated methylase